MKRFISFFILILILFTITVSYASNGNTYNGKVKYLNSVKIDDQEIKSNSNDLFEITSDIVYSTDSSQILVSGKASEGCEIFIYINERPKGFTTNDLSEKFVCGKSSIFAKMLDIKKGDNFILIIGKKDNTVQIASFKVKKENKENKGIIGIFLDKLGIK